MTPCWAVWPKFTEWYRKQFEDRYSQVSLSNVNCLVFQGQAFSHCMFCGVELLTGMVHPIPEQDSIRLAALAKLTLNEKIALGLERADSVLP